MSNALAKCFTGNPSLSTRYLLKFQSAAFASVSFEFRMFRYFHMGCARGPLTSTFLKSGNVTLYLHNTWCALKPVGVDCLSLKEAPSINSAMLSEFKALVQQRILILYGLYLGSCEAW